jgi:hypothetical protein
VGAAFNPKNANQLSSLIFDLEEELAFDGALSSTTKAALARRVMEVVSAGETDPERIKARILNRRPVVGSKENIDLHCRLTGTGTGYRTNLA